MALNKIVVLLLGLAAYTASATRAYSEAEMDQRFLAQIDDEVDDDIDEEDGLNLAQASSYVIFLIT